MADVRTDMTTTSIDRLAGIVHRWAKMTEERQAILDEFRQRGGSVSETVWRLDYAPADFKGRDIFQTGSLVEAATKKIGQ